MTAFPKSSVERNLIEAIRRRPDSDLPRLMYADWLEERSDPRGELIRVQCLLARMSPMAAGWADLEARERRLLSDHYEIWIEEPLVLIGVKRAEFRRGLIESLAVDAEQWLAQLPLLLERAPLVRHLTLSLAADLLDSVAGMSALEALDTLDLSSNGIGNPGAEILEQSPHLHRLRRLDMRGNRLGAPLIQRLAESPRLSPAVVLDVRDNRLRHQDSQLLRNTYNGRVIV